MLPADGSFARWSEEEARFPWLIDNHLSSPHASFSVHMVDGEGEEVSEGDTTWDTPAARAKRSVLGQWTNAAECLHGSCWGSQHSLEH